VICRVAIWCFDLIQLFRRYRRAISGAALAGVWVIGLRKLYRDIATLQAQGAKIDSAAGLGYLPYPGFLMPLSMFSEEEIEAPMPGIRWVTDCGDSGPWCTQA